MMKLSGVFSIVLILNSLMVAYSADCYSDDESMPQLLSSRSRRDVFASAPEMLTEEQRFKYLVMYDKEIALPRDFHEPYDVERYVSSVGKRVLTICGNSGTSYEKYFLMLEKVKSILRRYSRYEYIINIGATSQGIGGVYKIAKEMGFETMGIVSSELFRYPPAMISYYCDSVFFIPEMIDSWGGYVEGTNNLTPTSETIINVSSELICIGGGVVASAELEQAILRKIKTSYIRATMSKFCAEKKNITFMDGVALHIADWYRDRENFTFVDDSSLVVE